MMKEYGGYLPLELPVKKEYFCDIHEKDIVRLNCGRNTFWYALREIRPRKLYVPYLNCINSTDPAAALNIPYEFYELSEDLIPKDIKPQSGEAVLWINYYGNATQRQIDCVVQMCKDTTLIMDNCQAFFAKPLEGAYNCYSPRKFFGVCDGGYLIKKDVQIFDLPEEKSADYVTFLLRTIEEGVNACYPQSLKNEERLGKDVFRMSKLTQRILSSIDYKNIQQIRKQNFMRLHSKLKAINKFTVNIDSDTHINYPLLVFQEGLREYLIKNKIYTPTWWRHVPDYFTQDTIEVKLSKYMLMLPIDQRYDVSDMDDIVEIVMEGYRRNL